MVFLTSLSYTVPAPRSKVPIPLLKVLRDLRCGGLQRETFCLKVNNGFPEAGATTGKTDKTWHACSRLEPMKDALLACSKPHNHEANILATIAVCHFDNLLAISALI